MTGRRTALKNTPEAEVGGAPANAEGSDAGTGKQSFEKSMARLEKIVAEMESGELPLEEMIARFEEGQALIRLCAGKLNEVEKRVEMLVKKSDQVFAEPFDETAVGEGGEAAAKADGDDNVRF
jgi:exodeoxyribonuclease VII small subunit